MAQASHRNRDCLDSRRPERRHASIGCTALQARLQQRQGCPASRAPCIHVLRFLVALLRLTDFSLPHRERPPRPDRCVTRSRSRTAASGTMRTCKRPARNTCADLHISSAIAEVRTLTSPSPLTTAHERLYRAQSWPHRPLASPSPRLPEDSCRTALTPRSL